MEVNALVKVLDDVSGLPENEAKTAIYYCMATHRLKQFNWFPALCFVGPPGSGKSTAIDVLYQLCYKPYRIACHISMTPAGFRDALAIATRRTAIIEEVDQHPNRKQLLSYIINRIDKVRTANLPVKEQTETPSGLKKWTQETKTVFGATILHDRNSIPDPAAESRIISIETLSREAPLGHWPDIPYGLTLPAFKLGEVPAEFATGRMLNTWRPVIMAAAGTGDAEFLKYANLRVRETAEELRDGQIYEERLTIFAAVIESYCENSGLGFMVKDPLPIKAVADKLRPYNPLIHPKTVAKVLRKMGLTLRLKEGVTKLYTDEEELRAKAKNIGYVDEALG